MNVPETIQTLNRFEEQIRINREIRDAEIEAAIQALCRTVEPNPLTVQQIEDRLRVRPGRVKCLAKYFQTTIWQIKNLIAQSTKIRKGDAAWLRVWEPE